MSMLEELNLKLIIEFIPTYERFDEVWKER